MINYFGVLRNRILGSYRVAIKDGLKVGKGVTVMGGVNFGSEPYLIQLDDYVRISYGVSFVTHDGGTWAFRDLEGYEDVIKYGKIIIGAHSFVGCNSVIMPGVRIGERCVIGAGSVVVKDIPDGTVVAGIPAKVLCKTTEYAEKSRMLMKPYDIEQYKADKKNYLLKWLDNQ